ncbi:hypothetical protein PR048_026519 [Dryococelus australis]|uniref:Uncharacterized protein n=1 Tax=Dryococelus australis TaxID=614101 RepID=A0ABQ9GLM0_9NEOP|nr:hypothetical protein PR048_026519 [Dryococelus australis]
MVYRYGRDYYVNSSGEGRAKTERQPKQQAKVSGLSVTSLEEEMLQRDIYHFTFRARNASPNFLVNPLYEGGQWEGEHSHQAADKPRSESGYYSSLDSVAGEPQGLLRLTPPLQPQMVERTFESLSSIRRAASFKHHPSRGSRPPPVMGGSLRARVKGRGISAYDIW